MPTCARNVSPEAHPEGPAIQARREIFRVACAIGLYLIARPLWAWSGLESLYRGAVLGAAKTLFLPYQHFPVVLSIDPANASNFDHIVLFTICLLAVSTGVRWSERVKWLGLALPALFVLHVASTILRVRIASAVVLEGQFGLMVLLPWELYVVDTTSYLLYDLGLQLWPFMLLILTSSWVRAAIRGRRRSARSAWTVVAGKRWWLVIGVLAAVAVTFEIGSRVRERDPRHVAAHARAGHLFNEAANVEMAREHYEIAAAGRTTDVEVYHNLSFILVRRGELDLARRTLREGETICDSAACRQRFAVAIAQVDGAR